MGITRSKRLTKSSVDLSKPVVKPVVSADDCFGKEWNPSCLDCSLCSDLSVCGVVFKHNIQMKAIEIEEQVGQFLDNTSFDLISQKKLIKELQLSSGAYTTQELFDKLKTQSRCPDDETVIIWMKNFLIDNNFKTRGGVIYYKG